MSAGGGLISVHPDELRFLCMIVFPLSVAVSLIFVFYFGILIHIK